MVKQSLKVDLILYFLLFIFFTFLNFSQQAYAQTKRSAFLPPQVQTSPSSPPSARPSNSQPVPRSSPPASVARSPSSSPREARSSLRNSPAPNSPGSAVLSSVIKAFKQAASDVGRASGDAVKDALGLPTQRSAQPQGPLPNISTKEGPSGTVTVLELNPNITTIEGRDRTTHPNLDPASHTKTVRIGDMVLPWNPQKEGKDYKAGIELGRKIAEVLGIPEKSTIRKQSLMLYDVVTSLGSLAAAKYFPQWVKEMQAQGRWGDWTLNSGSQLTLGVIPTTDKTAKHFIGIEMNGPSSLEPYRVIDRLLSWQDSQGNWQLPANYTKDAARGYKWQSVSGYLGGFARFGNGNNTELFNPYVLDFGKFKGTLNSGGVIVGRGWKTNLEVRPAAFNSGLKLIAGKTIIDTTYPKFDPVFFRNSYQDIPAGVEPFRVAEKFYLMPHLDRYDLAIGTYGFGNTFKFAKNTTFAIRGQSFTGDIYVGIGTNPFNTNLDVYWQATPYRGIPQGLIQPRAYDSYNPFNQLTQLDRNSSGISTSFKDLRSFSLDSPDISGTTRNQFFRPDIRVHYDKTNFLNSRLSFDSQMSKLAELNPQASGINPLEAFTARINRGVSFLANNIYLFKPMFSLHNLQKLGEFKNLNMIKNNFLKDYPLARLDKFSNFNLNSNKGKPLFSGTVFRQIRPDNSFQVPFFALNFGGKLNYTLSKAISRLPGLNLETPESIQIAEHLGRIAKLGGDIRKFVLGQQDHKTWFEAIFKQKIKHYVANFTMGKLNSENYLKNPQDLLTKDGVDSSDKD